MILDSIVEKKLVYLSKKKKECSLDVIKAKANDSKIIKRSFSDALVSFRGISIIGEIKKASPSKGLIKKDFFPAELAKQYNDANVQALSVLTERDFFQGNESYLVSARKNCKLPVLRKDFIIDSWQIYESYLLGADAILLIVAILDDKKLLNFFNLAQDLNMDALVEVHNIKELDRALKIDPKIIGINNRNLINFTVSLSTTETLIKYIPKEKIVVGESGIHTKFDVDRMKTAGVNALLIGESLMRAVNIANTVKSLRGES